MDRETFVELVREARNEDSARAEFEMALGKHTDLSESPLFSLLNTLPEILADGLQIPESSLDAWYDCYWEFVSKGSTYLLDEDNDKIIIDSAERLYDMFYDLCGAYCNCDECDCDNECMY